MFSKGISTTTAPEARQDEQYGEDKIVNFVIKWWTQYIANLPCTELLRYTNWHNFAGPD